MITKEIQENWIQAIKDCGQSLIDNAEEIAGNYDLQTGVNIFISLNPGEFVEIEISTTYIPNASKSLNTGVCLLSGKSVYNKD